MAGYGLGEWRRCRGSEGGAWGLGWLLGELRKCWGSEEGARGRHKVLGGVAGGVEEVHRGGPGRTIIQVQEILLFLF